MKDDGGWIFVVIVIGFIIIGIMIGVFITRSYYRRGCGMVDPIDEIKCKDGTYQVLIEEKDESTTWYDTKKACQ
jgi:hypothetical protein